MSTLKVDSLVEKTSGNGVHIAGHVIQVVQNTTGGSVDNSTSQTYVDAISVTILPKSSSSKFLVNFTGCYDTDAGGRQAFFRIVRTIGGSSSTVSGYDTTLGSAYNGGDRQISNMHIQYLDSPNSTNSITYTLQFAPWGSFNIEWNSQGVRSVATAQEIAQ